VLLKNDDHLLPIGPNGFKVKTVAVFGDNSTIVGHGSGQVNFAYMVTPMEGLQSALPGVNVVYGGSDPSTAPSIAAFADVCVVVVAYQASEGSDRLTQDNLPDLSLPSPFDALVDAVASVQPNVVVSARCPGPCLMPWLSSVKAVVWSGYGGQEAGNSLADVLTGAVNPSGKLVLSFPTSTYDTWLGNPVNPGQYPGTDRGAGFPETDYAEKLFVGYRWYDQRGTDPLFSFGYGLSYTSFLFSELSVKVNGVGTPNVNVSVSFTVQNSGAVSGKEVAQVYLTYPVSEVDQPPKLLKGFKKTPQLEPFAVFEVSVVLKTRDISVFNVVADDWTVPSGTFGISVGAGSRDIRLTSSFTL
jgi:beta-glucosidase